MTMKKIWTLPAVLLALTCAGTALYAEETPVTDDAIKSLVKNLGSDDFDQRIGAEKSLARMGERAEPILKATMEATTDPQIRATAARLLGKLRLAGLKSIDYKKVFPKESVLFVQINNVGETLKESKETAVGKLFLSAAMEPFRAKLEAAINAEADKKQLFDLWSSRFKGQFGLALWNFSPDPATMGLAGIAEITDPNPQAVFDDFLAETKLDAVKAESYRDVDIFSHPLQGGAIALAGTNVLISMNRDSVKKLIDNLFKPEGLSTVPEAANLFARLGEKPYFIYGVEYQSYLKQLMGMMAMQMPPAMLESFNGFMKTSGADNLRWTVYGGSIAGDQFEDRFLVTFAEEPVGIMAVGQTAADAKPVLDDMAIIPANAVAASIGSIDGKVLREGLKTFLKGFGEMMEMQRKALPPEMQAQSPSIDALMKMFTEKTGVALEDVFSGAKGSIGYYAVLGPGGILEAPDIGMFMTFIDNAEAEKFSATLRKGLDSLGPQAAVREIEAPDKRKLLQLDLVAAGAKVPEKFPYSPTWVVEGNRLFVGSSVVALRKQLSYIDNKTPGLLTQAEFVKAMGRLTPEERRGNLFYVDMKSLLTLGATVGMPLLQASIPDPALQQALAALPPPPELFKDMPPLLGTSIHQGKRAESVIRGPVPPAPTLLALIVGGFLVMRPHAMPPPQPDDPGGF
jgi:hypothetical protein